MFYCNSAALCTFPLRQSSKMQFWLSLALSVFYILLQLLYATDIERTRKNDELTLLLQYNVCKTWHFTHPSKKVMLLTFIFLSDKRRLKESECNALGDIVTLDFLIF